MQSWNQQNLCIEYQWTQVIKETGHSTPLRISAFFTVFFIIETEELPPGHWMCDPRSAEVPVGWSDHVASSSGSESTAGGAQGRPRWSSLGRMVNQQIWGYHGYIHGMLRVYMGNHGDIEYTETTNLKENDDVSRCLSSDSCDFAASKVELAAAPRWSQAIDWWSRRRPWVEWTSRWWGLVPSHARSERSWVAELWSESPFTVVLFCNGWFVPLELFGQVSLW